MRLSEGPFPVYEILPGQVYQRGKMHRLDPEVKRAGLAHYGIAQTVALAPLTPDPHLMGTAAYTHLPIPDGRLSPETADRLLVVAHRLACGVAEGRAVLTLCNAGRNRSGLLSALLVRELSGLPGAQALNHVRAERPNALANLHFEEFLRSLP